MQEKVILLSSEGLGRGDEELGKILMPKFLRVLRESEDKPKTIICWNTAVKLVCEGSLVLKHLKALERSGIEILACGTCLAFFGLTEKVKVGKVSNMNEITDLLVHKEIVSL